MNPSQLAYCNSASPNVCWLVWSHDRSFQSDQSMLHPTFLSENFIRKAKHGSVWSEIGTPLPNLSSDIRTID